MVFSQKQIEIRELIDKVRLGEEEAFASLLSAYSPLIESLVAKFQNDGSLSFSKEDLLQEATVVFYNSIMTYDLEQTDVEFGLYAKICISNALVSRMRALKRVSAESLTDTPIDSLFANDSDYEDPGARILEQENLKALYSIIRKNLSAFEYKVWQMYMSGRTAADIATAVGKDEKSVTNAIYRIRKKLRAQLR